MAVSLASQRSVTARFESRLANVHKNLQELTYIKAYVGIQAHVSNVPKREEECKSIQWVRERRGREGGERARDT